MNISISVLSAIFLAKSARAGTSDTTRRTSLALLPLLTLAISGTALAAAPAQSSRYKLEIATPAVPVTLSPLLHAAALWSQAQRAEFLQGLPDPGLQPPPHGEPWLLHIEYQPVMTAGGFASLIGEGYNWSGGAHPNPILKTLNYDSRSQRMISLADLFGQPDPAISAICMEARRQLLARLHGPAGTATLNSDPSMIEQGTQPGPHTLDLFVFTGSPAQPVPTLRVLFASYAVAPYVAGSQQVDIDPRVFARWLKPQYQARFKTAKP